MESNFSSLDRDAYYATILEQVRETQKKARESIERSALVKQEIEESLRASEEVDRKFEKFKSDFGEAINKLAVQLKESVQPTVINY